MVELDQFKYTLSTYDETLKEPQASEASSEIK